MWLHFCRVVCVKGDPDFLGRLIVTPSVISDHQTYSPTPLTWHEVRRGSDSAGEILASFELIQVLTVTSLRLQEP